VVNYLLDCDLGHDLPKTVGAGEPGVRAIAYRGSKRMYTLLFASSQGVFLYRFSTSLDSGESRYSIRRCKDG